VEIFNSKIESAVKAAKETLAQKDAMVRDLERRERQLEVDKDSNLDQLATAVGWSEAYIRQLRAMHQVVECLINDGPGSSLRRDKVKQWFAEFDAQEAREKADDEYVPNDYEALGVEPPVDRGQVQFEVFTRTFNFTSSCRIRVLYRVSWSGESG
jgi:hypothetical protein